MAREGRLPVIFLKDVSPKHLELLLQYMYKGEIKVQENELVTVLNVAQALEVKGLTESTDSGKEETDRMSRRVSPPPPPAVKRAKVSRSQVTEVPPYSQPVKQETPPAVIDIDQVRA